MKPIVFSQHAQVKQLVLAEHGFRITEERVRDCIETPELIQEGHGECMIAQRGFDSRHVLRVVYEEQENAIIVVTTYPGRKERYEEGQVQ